MEPDADFTAHPDWVPVAEIRRPRGNRGEVAATPLGGTAEMFRQLRNAILCGDSEDRAVEIESAWFHQDSLILKFAGVDSIGSAEELRGMEVRIAPEERERLGFEAYFFDDLLGCDVVDETAGLIGQVEGVQETPGDLLLEAGGVLIPMVPEICRKVDVQARRIDVVLPEGLRELNRPGEPDRA